MYILGHFGLFGKNKIVAPVEIRKQKQTITYQLPLQGSKNIIYICGLDHNLVKDISQS